MPRMKESGRHHRTPSRPMSKPPEAVLVEELLTKMGVTAYEPNVTSQLMAILHRASAVLFPSFPRSASSWVPVSVDILCRVSHPLNPP